MYTTEKKCKILSADDKQVLYNAYWDKNARFIVWNDMGFVELFDESSRKINLPNINEILKIMQKISNNDCSKDILLKRIIDEYC